MMTPNEKAAVLIETLPWLERFHGATVVIKYGGNAMIDPELQRQQIASLAQVKAGQDNSGSAATFAASSAPAACPAARCATSARTSSSPSPTTSSASRSPPARSTPSSASCSAR